MAFTAPPVREILTILLFMALLLAGMLAVGNHVQDVRAQACSTGSAGEEAPRLFGLRVPLDCPK